MELRDRILEKYEHHVLEHGQAPPSVFKFARDLEITEREFFEHFASFDAVERQFWRGIATEVIAAIQSGPEWGTFDARQKMLTLTFAFLEKALDHRSFFLARFPCLGKNPANSTADGLRRDIHDFALDVLREGKERSEIPERGPLNRAYPAALSNVFLTAIDFWLKDESTGFERTDAYVEKSFTLAFDLIGSSAIDSAVDLVRFLTQRSRV